MEYRSWKVRGAGQKALQLLEKQMGLPPLLARLLAARGVESEAQANEILLENTPLSDPFLLKDMDKAVARILQAVDGGENILIFGDYDVDGVTATALLADHLRGMGANVKCMLPSREGEGYGLSEKAVRTAAEKGFSLIVTVDNGISALAEAQLAAQLGVDLVITDHHLPPEQLPPAVAVVDPMRDDDQSPCKSLCGAGVAFKLCAALDGCDPEELLEFCGDLAAIGTIADVMDLRGENRTLVRWGVQSLQNPDRPGLRALIQASGLGDKDISAENVSYILAPRLNAAGRMGKASTALSLLLCEDYDRAQALAEELCRSNQARQEEEGRILAQVRRQLEEEPGRQNDRVLVVWGEDYHPGVIGIVASRLVEQYGRPALVLSLQGEEGRGSGRSVPGLNLHDALAGCADLLVRYGGHALAAGLTVRRENLEELRRRLNAWALATCPVPQLPPLELDLEVRLDQLDMEGVLAFHALEPYGQGNPTPSFLARGLEISGIYPAGEKHSRLRLTQDGVSLYAAYFGVQPEQLPYRVGDRVDAALTVSVYQGRSGPMLSGRLRALRPAGQTDEVPRQAALFRALEGQAALNEEEKSLLRPSREDVAAVYREIRAGGVPAEDLQPLFARLGEGRTGKILAGLCALRQLNLVELARDEQASVYRAVRTTEKKDLASAPILHSLEVSR